MRRNNRQVNMVTHSSQRKKTLAALPKGLWPLRQLYAAWLLLALMLVPQLAHAQAVEIKKSAQLPNGERIGSVSGLPVPRFASLRVDRVNLRQGPSLQHPASWVYERAGLPVEIIGEFDVWRKVRDSEGTEGWVLHTLLSARRTALVAPWKKSALFTLRARPAKDAPPVARLQSGVIAAIKSCDGHWCRISGKGFTGYIRQTTLWGVYPDEKIE